MNKLGARYLSRAINAERTLVQRFRVIRESSGLAQQDLAQMAGSSQTAVTRIETGSSHPTLLFFLALLDVMGYEVKITKRSACDT